MTHMRVAHRAWPSPPTAKRGHHLHTLGSPKQALRCRSNRAFLQRCTLCGDFSAMTKMQGPEQLEGPLSKPPSRPSPGRSAWPRAPKQVTSIRRRLTVRTVKMFRSQTGRTGKERGGKFGSFYQLITPMPSRRPLYDQTPQNCFSYLCSLS